MTTPDGRSPVNVSYPVPSDEVMATWARRRRARLVLAVPVLLLFVVPFLPFTQAWWTEHFAGWLLATAAVIVASASWAYLGRLARCPRCDRRVQGSPSPSYCPNCGVALK